MALELYFHPLSSFCQKVLIALYENDTPFQPHIVDLSNEASAAPLRRLWPIGKFPVLRDGATNRTVPESSLIIEYLDRQYPGRTQFLPTEPDFAHEARTLDRFFDLYVNERVGKIVTDRQRPAPKRDAYGVELAKAQLQIALDMVDRDMATKNWAMGATFGLADCAAAPALFYADLVMPFGATHKHAAAYLHRLLRRPSFARAVQEAEPYRALFPR